MNGVITRGQTYVGIASGAKDSAGFHLVFEQQYRDILAYAARRSSLTEAEDIAAETFTIAWRKWASAPPDAVRPWLFGIARKVVANNNRTMRRRKRLSAKLVSLDTESSAGHSYGEHGEVENALGKLGASGGPSQCGDSPDG